MNRQEFELEAHKIRSKYDGKELLDQDAEKEKSKEWNKFIDTLNADIIYNYTVKKDCLEDSSLIVSSTYLDTDSCSGEEIVGIIDVLLAQARGLTMKNFLGLLRDYSALSQKRELLLKEYNNLKEERDELFKTLNNIEGEKKDG